jgi:CheY-like chemotaxis protein
MLCKVLLINNDPDVRGIISVVLRSQGYDVIQAVNGIECLTHLKKGKPDLIILDLLMPSMDGFNVFKTLKSPDCPEYNNIPVAPVQKE